MNSSVYAINKGINRPIVFQGVKAQYIGYLAGGLVGLIILFAILYICGVNSYACIVIVLGAGTWLIAAVSKMSRKYGRHGLMKRQAKRLLPDYLWFNSRKVFIQLKKA
jgi:Domain of unknown function (DUF4133)